MNTAYADLLARTREHALLLSCSAVLGWDQQTYLPRGGAAVRGEQLALLASLAHGRATDPRLGELLAECEANVAAIDDEFAAANLRELRHSTDRAVKLPKRLVEELARVTSDAHEAWADARMRDDFASFLPHLRRIVELKREEAAAVGFRGEAYDALLDEYEPGATTAAIAALFADLTAELSPAIRAALESGKRPRPGVLERDYPVERQKWFAEGAAAAIGFDFGRGRLDVAAHPFCSAFGPGDCRLTTRYNPKFFNEAFFGVLHEAGHGLYEQNLPADRFGQPAGQYCSLGVHESQSRLWENQVGRSADYWHAYFPRLKQAFPGTLDDVNPDDFLFAVCEVRPSLIRVEADEATYNLHVAVRFELERALISGDLAVPDLPAAWGERFRALLGLPVPNDREGCLQDIHWSFGGFGYFPTYTLGNLYAAQLMDAATRSAPDLRGGVRRGDFSPLKSWLVEHVHVHGRRYRAGELCERATGGPLDAASFLAYLRGKLSRFYGVC